MRSILIIDDDVRLSDMLRQLLARHEISLTTRLNGTDGLDEGLEHRYDLVLLDVLLPDIHGLEVLRRLRETSNIPIILLTAWGDTVERVRGLRMGADDFLPKPFNVEELVARIDAVLRRSVATMKFTAAMPGEPQLQPSMLTIDPRSRTALYGTEELDLTDIEFLLLERFLRSPGVILSREELAVEVLQRPFHPLDRSLDMSISRLRRKLRSSTPLRDPIKTIRNSGYMLSATDAPLPSNQMH